MAIFRKKTPWEKEWDDLLKREAKFTAKRKEGPTSVLVKKLDRFVPEKLSGTLNTAFFKAFELIFEKGTSIIEKTYNKKKRETDFKVNTYANEIQADKKTARQFTKQAKSAKTMNLAISSVEGVGLGIVGLGIPDIPLFITMVLKSIYEIALSYGYEYESDEEKIFILKIIETAMCDEEEFINKDENLNEDIHQIVLAGDYMEPECWTITKRADESNIRSPFCRNDLYKIPAGTVYRRNRRRNLRSDLCRQNQRLRCSQIQKKIFGKQTCRRLIFFKIKKVSSRPSSL